MDSVRRLAPPLVALLVLLAVAELAVRASGVGPAVLPTPSEVARALVADAGTLLAAARQTALEVLVGLLLAAALGLGAALVMHRLKLVGDALRPLLVASQAIPIPAIAPALALWLGYSFWTRVVVVVLVAFFPVAVAAADALRRADRDLVDLYRSFQASPARILRDVELPGALPAVISGVRVAAAFAVVGAVLGEWVGASDGLGYLILVASNGLHADVVFACVVLLAAIALTLVGACTLVERRLAPWARR